MTAVLSLTINFELSRTLYSKIFVFDAGFISFVAQVIYYWISSIWTFQHLIWPNTRGLPSRSGLWARLVKVFSIPTTTDFHAQNRLAFSIFYTCVTTFPLVTTFLYWFVLEAGGRDLEEDLTPQVNMRIFLHCFNAIIAVVEILLLSSVRKQEPFISHLVNVLFIVGLYFVWAFAGYEITGQYIYKQLDHTIYGGRAVVMAITTTMSLTTAFLLMNIGLHQMRDYATAKAECNRQNL
ncbi:hypothetical protein MMC19_004315 [Ptychographa xylographoides]|nr:hypothetical protein [Ptychographa xylographoides]